MADTTKPQAPAETGNGSVKLIEKVDKAEERPVIPELEPLDSEVSVKPKRARKPLLDWDEPKEAETSVTELTTPINKNDISAAKLHITETNEHDLILTGHIREYGLSLHRLGGKEYKNHTTNKIEYRFRRDRARDVKDFVERVNSGKVPPETTFVSPEEQGMAKSDFVPNTSHAGKQYIKYNFVDKPIEGETVIIKATQSAKYKVIRAVTNKTKEVWPPGAIDEAYIRGVNSDVVLHIAVTAGKWQVVGHKEPHEIKFQPPKN